MQMYFSGAFLTNNKARSWQWLNEPEFSEQYHAIAPCSEPMQPSRKMFQFTLNANQLTMILFQAQRAQIKQSAWHWDWGKRVGVGDGLMICVDAFRSEDQGSCLCWRFTLLLAVGEQNNNLYFRKRSMCTSTTVDKQQGNILYTNQYSRFRGKLQVCFTKYQ